MAPWQHAHAARKVAGALAMIALSIWPPSIALCQTDADDYASTGEWIFLAVLTAIGTSLLVLITVVWHRRRNPHTGLPARVKRRRARGPVRGGRLN
jgi:hypothetical protein